MRFLGGFFIATILFASQIAAQSPGPLRVEGHAFSASTMRPLPGVSVELWAFYDSGPETSSVTAMTTDEGGFYWAESPFTLVDNDGNDRATGYAYAFICRYGSDQKVQIMPLYHSLTPGQVYSRNIYMNVPAHVAECSGH